MLIDLSFPLHGDSLPMDHPVVTLDVLEIEVLRLVYVYVHPETLQRKVKICITSSCFLTLRVTSQAYLDEGELLKVKGSQINVHVKRMGIILSPIIRSA